MILIILAWLLSNCSLINLEDMLQNGTCINKVMIEKPHRFITACTIATQIILGVTSLQYGGATITLTHLAPFVRDSYNKYYEKYKSWGLSDDDCNKYAEVDKKKLPMEFKHLTISAILCLTQTDKALF